MRSHGWGSFQLDPAAASDLLQGVTTEVFGEAFSPGPSDGRPSRAMRHWLELAGGFPRLSDGLDCHERTGVAPDVASFMGGVNLRGLGASSDDRRLNGQELDRWPPTAARLWDSASASASPNSPPPKTSATASPAWSTPSFADSPVR